MTQPKQVLYSPVDIDDADFVDMELDEKMASENAEFEAFKDEMHDAQFDAKITVGKKLTDSNGRPLGRQVFECFECGIDDYTFSQLCTRIREDFGTGLYKIQGRDSKGKFKFNKMVGILAPNKTDNEPAGTDIGNLFDKFSDAMARQQMQTEAMFTKLAGPQTGGDAIDQITKLATAVGPLLAAIGFGKSEAPKTLLEQLTEYKMMQELFTEGGGSGGGDANLYSLLTATMQSFGAPIAAALAAGQIDGSVNPQGILASPQPALVDTDKIKREQETEALKGQIKILVANAEAKTDAVKMANLIVEKTPEDNLESLFDFLSGDDYLEQMIFLVPEVEIHKNWFIKLRDTVLELLTVDDDKPIVPESETVAETTGPDISDKANGDAPKDS